MNVINKNNTEAGFSLVELLISISLSMILVNLLIHTYIFLEKQSNMLKERIRLEENAKFGQFLLMHEVQSAGFIGCNQCRYLNIKYHFKNKLFPFTPLQITSRLNHNLGKNIHPESDILMVEKMSEITAPAPHQSNREEIYIISDCEKSDFIKSDPFKINLKSLGYKENIKIGKLIATAFFIEKTRKKELYGKSIYSLYSYDLIHHQKSEYISNIKEMHFSYAVHDGGDNFHFEEIDSDCILSHPTLLKINLKLLPENNWFFSDKVSVKDVEIYAYVRN